MWMSSGHCCLCAAKQVGEDGEHRWVGIYSGDGLHRGLEFTVRMGSTGVVGSTGCWGAGTRGCELSVVRCDCQVFATEARSYLRSPLCLVIA